MIPNNGFSMAPMESSFSGFAPVTVCGGGVKPAIIRHMVLFTLMLRGATIKSSRCNYRSRRVAMKLLYSTLIVAMFATLAACGADTMGTAANAALLKKQELDEHAQKLIAEKKAEFVERSKQTDAFSKSHFPEGAQLCGKCSTAAVVMMDGCMTCLNCADSKCG
jgi:hypothetical protein